ncbi:hypothetical protein GN956_G14679 [Arapaima gigas]
MFICGRSGSCTGLTPGRQGDTSTKGLVHAGNGAICTPERDSTQPPCGTDTRHRMNPLFLASLRFSLLFSGRQSELETEVIPGRL